MGRRHMVYTPQRKAATVRVSERSDGPNVLCLGRSADDTPTGCGLARIMHQMIATNGTEDRGGFRTNANRASYVHNEEAK
ncbi:hypothetical protein P8452_61248 [Trifolium repens]|jgi:hypothetical protein|nr:hypothetical protein P8452_61248 [Trifolium repens]